MKVIVPVDVRPTIIKVAPIVKEMERRGVEFRIVHTGQHYSRIMSDVFFEDLDVPEPDFNLGVGSGTQAEQVGKGLIGLEKYFKEEEPDFVLVHGDANMVPAACMAAVKLFITTIHKEAGLRSFDRKMPEEINRIIGDHISDNLFAPTDNSKKNLLCEGVPESRIDVTGNTIVDAVNFIVEKSKGRKPAIEIDGDYVLLTLHRAGHVDSKEKLVEILSGVEKFQSNIGVKIVCPMHPRTKARIEEFKLQQMVKGIDIIDPLPYVDFINIMKRSKLVMADSGGVQEESCTLGVPCVTIGNTTERVESIHANANVLAGIDADNIAKCAKIMIEKKGTWQNPFGDGRSANRIVNRLLEIDESKRKPDTRRGG